MKHIFLLAIYIISSFSLYAQVPTKWRGANSNGIYNEKGLLKQWPETGPEIAWSYNSIGEGYSSPAFANNKIYVTGMIDSIGYLFILNDSGKLISKIEYGSEFVESFPGSRSTPVVVGNLIYIYSGFGKLYCFNETTKEQVWMKDMFNDFDGSNIKWAVTETVVVDGETVFCSPGGTKNNIVALNRLTGKLIWSSPAKGDLSAYCTPLLIEHNGRKLLITMMANSIIGLDASTGKMLWSYEQTNQWSVHANTPIYYKGSIVCMSGYGKGAVKLDISTDGNSVTKAWFNAKFDGRFGGLVLINGFIYASGDKNRTWQCVNWTTGEQTYSSNTITKGAVIANDEMLYCYSEKGEVALVEANPTAFVVKGLFKEMNGSGPHWAHPAINNGRLFIRHGDTLIAYSIK